MLDRSSKLDDSLMDAYRSIHEVHKGHAAGESDIEKQASQLASDIRYKAKGRIRDGMNAEDKKRIYLKLLASSPAPGIVKNKAKRKLLGESVLINEIVPAGDTASERKANRDKVVSSVKNADVRKIASKGREKATSTAKKVVGKVIRGAAGIAKREGTLSQKVTGAAIDAVKGRAKKALNWADSKTKKADTSSSTYNPSSTSYSKKGVGRKDRVSSSQTKSETASSYKARSEKKKTQQSQSLGQQARNNPEKKKEMIRARGGKTESFSNWKLELLGEEGYDHWRDKHLERGGIGAVASKSPSRPYKRSEKQPKGDTAYQKEMKAKHGGKLPSALDVVKSKIEKEHGKGAIMKTEETSAADKIINNIRSKRVDEGKLVHGPFGPYISGQKMPKEQREVPLRKVPYEDINSAKKVVGEAKVDKVKHGDHNLYDNPGKEKDRNERKFGKQSFNQKGQTQLRRGLHWSKRGDKKVKGAKVEEEVGVSSSAAMTKARQEAELKSKEEAAVKKAKKAKNEEVAPAVDKVIESIKINKASPKSPNCIIMPKKDDIADKAGGNGKKSTKNVVSKKQKQFFNQEGKTYKDFLKEYVQALTKAAASQAAKGAITTTAKTVGKETVKKTGSAVAKQTGGAIVKSGGSAVAKQTGGAIVKKGGGSIVKSGGGKLATKGGALAKVKKGGKEIVKQGSSQLAVNKAGELANRDKGVKPEPKKQDNQSKGFDLKWPDIPKPKKHTGIVGNIRNPQ